MTIKIYIENLFLNKEGRTKSNSHNNNITPPEPSQTTPEDKEIHVCRFTHPEKFSSKYPYLPKDSHIYMNTQYWLENLLKQETHPPIKEEPYKPEEPKTKKRRIKFVWE